MKLSECFDIIHPRKTVPVFEPYDWAGRRYPRELNECYGRHSYAKDYAHKQCVEMYNQLNGQKFSITSHNTFMFVVEFEFPNPESGELMHARITRDHNECWFVA